MAVRFRTRGYAPSSDAIHGGANEPKILYRRDCPWIDDDRRRRSKRDDGRRQVTYGGWPPYYYRSDTKPGQTRGQDLDSFGADWFLVAPSGRVIEGHKDEGSGMEKETTSSSWSY